ncbi:hypothetical protein ACS3SW_14050 [Roseobacteraceae bacterium S113]
MLELTKTRFVEGVWEGVLTGTDAAPDITVHHMGRVLTEPKIEQHPEAGWSVRVELPATVLSDGVQTVVLADADSGAQLEAIHVVAGDPLDDDLRAEMQLLREELDMLKRAFRRHCVETA